MTQTRSELRTAIKRLMVDTLMLRREPETIADDAPILGSEGLGLDSIDTITLLAELERHFGITIVDAERAKAVLKSVDSIVDAVLAQAPPARSVQT